jgi:hypothetical protein
MHAGGAVQVAVGNASIGGLVTAASGPVTVDTVGSLAIQGILPVGRSPVDTLAAEAVVQSPVEVLLTAGAGINLGDAAKLTAADVRITAATTVTLSGQVTADDEAVLAAGTDVTLDGVLTAGGLIDAPAIRAARSR